MQQCSYIAILLNFSSSNTKMMLQQWSYNQIFLLLSYSAHLSLDVHCSSKLKKKNYFICVDTWLEYFFFFLLLPHFYPLLLSPLIRSSPSPLLTVASFNSSTHRWPKPLPNVDLSLRRLLSLDRIQAQMI